MVIQITDREGHQIKQLKNADVDFDLNGKGKDFQVTIPASEFDNRIVYGGRIFAEGTEIGGVFGELYTDTSIDSISWSGFTWRGLLSKKIIIPPEGQDYRVVSGELNSILRSLIEPMFSGVFVVPEIETGVKISSYQFVRYCTLLDGIEDMLRSVNHRIDIMYNSGEPNGTGYVEVKAVPVMDYSKSIELSQDSRLDFTMSDKRNGVNHLIVLGQGELKDRTVVDLYLQSDGSVGDSKYYTGIDEIVDIYENTNAVEPDLSTEGKKRLLELANKKTFDMNVESLSLGISIGDIVGGRDYITGMSMARPLKNILIQVKNDIVTKQYELEGN